jgi:hypothetical protein
MRWLVNVLNAVRSAIPAYILMMVARSKRACRAAERDFGIRVISMQADGIRGEAELRQVWCALMLLQQLDPERLRRVNRQIKVIILGSFVKTALYLRTRRMCILNVRNMPRDWTEQDAIVELAGTLVGMATYGVFDEKGVPFCGSAASRVKTACVSEGDRTVRRLATLLETTGDGELDLNV